MLDVLGICESTQLDLAIICRELQYDLNVNFVH